MVIDVPTLLTLNDTQLNDIFRSGVADPIPDGGKRHGDRRERHQVLTADRGSCQPFRLAGKNL
jgi:hypothetical protein